MVRDSWRRSLGSGVDPDGGGPPVDLLDDDLLAYRAAHPLAPVMPVIRRLLVEDAEADQMIVAVTDAGGRMLWVEGDSAAARRAAGMHFVEGARWAEDVAGTNAPGTALAVDHAVQIYGSEHYRRPVQPWSCSAAPVHDPVTGVLLGAIDVTGGDHVASPHVLTLVRATVAAVESELRWQHREQLPRPPAAGRLRCAPGARLDVLGRERARLPCRPGRSSCRCGTPSSCCCSPRPPSRARGAPRRSSPPSATPATPRPVTVRAELSRLRRLVGADLVGSRPYRLLGRVDTDLDQVRRLLARGAVGAALERYPRRRAAGVARARASRRPGSGCRRCSVRPCCAAAARSCCCATRSCPRPATTSWSGRPAWSGCRRARPAGRPPRRTCCGCAAPHVRAELRAGNAAGRRSWPSE